jgi:hypothetical protein
MFPVAVEFIALELANERAREADRFRLAALATRSTRSGPRRIIARAAATVAGALDRLAVRLDDTIEERGADAAA